MTTMLGSHRTRRAAAVLAAAAFVGVAVAYAAGVGEPDSARHSAAGEIRIVDNDNDQPLFTLSNMGPGETETACIAVTNESPVQTEMSLNGAIAGTLAPFLDLTVERGTDPVPQPRSCDGFVREAEVWSGSLADFPARAQAGVSDAPLGAGATRVYRYTVALRDDNAAQGLRSDVAFDFNATGEPPAPEPTPDPTPTPTPTPTSPPRGDTPDSNIPVPIPTNPGETCSDYYLLGNRVVRTAAKRKRTRARLVIRRVGKGKAQRLQLRTTLKGATGRQLPAKRWLRVEYRRNGKRIAVSKRRPFRVTIKPTVLRTGVNRLQVRVRGRNVRAASVRATFRLTIGKALLKGRTVCVVNKETRVGAASR